MSINAYPGLEIEVYRPDGQYTDPHYGTIIVLSVLGNYVRVSFRNTQEDSWPLAGHNYYLRSARTHRRLVIVP